MAKIRSRAGQLVHDVVASANLREGERLHAEVIPGHSHGAKDRGRAYARASEIEDRYLDAIELRREIEIIGPILEKLNKGQLDVAGLFQGVAPSVAISLLRTALAGETEKNRLEAQKQILGYAGFSTTTRHEIGRLDPATPKEALLALIAGAAPQLKSQGVEVVDTDDDKDKP